MLDTDVFVLGGGPAGLAAAIAARARGLRVVLADAEKPPIDKACGEGLMPDSIEAAAQLGITIPRSAGCPFRGIRFRSAQYTVAADFPNGSGLGVRRTVLQALLAEFAERADVKLLWRTPVTGIRDGLVLIGSERVLPRWIIGADGSQSSVRRWAGLQHFRRSSQRFSYRRHYAIAPWSEYMEIHWGDRCQFYITPVNTSEICVVLTTRDQHQRVTDALPLFPDLRCRLQHVPVVTPERGAYAVTRKLSRVTHSNVALIGDASGNVDPITGEGLCLAFKHAKALADALVAGDLSLYESAHRGISRRPRVMADFMLLMDRSNQLQQSSMRAFAERPSLFADLLRAHVGQSSPFRLALAAASLVWKVATP
jgi:flavin-dependent dehydrogenase